MSLRVRVLQSLVLGLIGLSLILYSSMVYNPNLVYRIETHSNHESVNSSIKLVNHSDIHDQPKEDGKGVGSASGTRGAAYVPVASSSGNVSETDKKKSPPKKAGPNSVVTKDIYEAGHLIANADLCPDLGRKMKLMVLITSSPNHAEPRMAIRQTWGHFNQRRDIGIGFVVGEAKSTQINEKIQAESEMYGDIIQARSTDIYDNLTLKTISMFEWMDSYCPEVPFLLKTDDDMFINIPKLLAFTEKQANAQRKIFGRLAKKWQPVRNSASKYFVNKLQFPQNHFPDFTTGPAYLVTRDAIHDIYNAALEGSYLKLEDVYITGVVAQNISVKRIHVTEFYNKKIPFNVCTIRKAISIHMVKFFEQFVLWEKFNDNRIRCK